MSQSEIILQEKVENLGNLGDIVQVKPGFARNFLFPKGKAKPATAKNKAEFEAGRAELENLAKDVLSTAIGRTERLADMKVTITSKAGDEGKLFGSIGTRYLAEAITAAGVDVSKKEICLPEGPLRHTGEFSVQLKLHTDVLTTILVEIVAE